MLIEHTLVACFDLLKIKESKLRELLIVTLKITNEWCNFKKSNILRVQLNTDTLYGEAIDMHQQHP